MEYKKLILSPGPTNIPREYMDEMAKEFPHHRTQEFSTLFLNLTNNLKKIIDNDGELILFTSSGSGAMESSVVNFFNPKDKVLVIDTGFFGKRYKQICEIYGLEVIHLECPIGESFDFAEVQKILSQNQDIKAIFATHHETSTGVINDIKTLGTLNHENMLLIVDSISGLIMHPFSMKDYNVDVLCGGCQKGFLVPPGVSFVGLSKKALSWIPKSTLPKYYYSYELMLNSAKINQTLTTPAISIMQTFLKATEDILNNGLRTYQEHHLNMRKYLEKLFIANKFKLVISNENNRGNVVVLVYLPENTDAVEICQYLDEKHNIIIMPGLGNYVNTMIRIGVIGPLNTKHLDLFFEALKDTFLKLYNIKLGE